MAGELRGLGGRERRKVVIPRWSVCLWLRCLVGCSSCRRRRGRLCGRCLSSWLCSFRQLSNMVALVSCD